MPPLGLCAVNFLSHLTILAATWCRGYFRADPGRRTGDP